MVTIIYGNRRFVYAALPVWVPLITEVSLFSVSLQYSLFSSILSSICSSLSPSIETPVFLRCWCFVTVYGFH